MTELKHKKIVVVDDDLFISELYSQHLQNSGFKNVMVCNTGVDLLSKLIGKPDIIFLDYQMDNLNGFELLKKIKRFDPNIIVVMVSGQDEMTIAIDSLKYGAFDYIVKGDSDTEKITAVLERINTFQKETTKRKSASLFGFKSLFRKN